MKLFLVLALGGALSATAADSLDSAYAAYGRLLTTQFVSAPFPHAARATGHTYQNKTYPAAEHYSDSTVSIFIPQGFRESSQMDFVIHFHGWFNTVSGTLKTFQLVEQFVAAGKNAILVVPEGPHNAPDSFGGKLEDPDGFKRFMAEVVTTLQQRAGFKRKEFAPGKIILSGHSGGYRVMSGIVARGGMTEHIKEVWLFDALYAETDKFLAWSEQTHGRLVNIYTDHGGTKDDSEAMMELLRKRGTKFFAGEETALQPSQLRDNKLLFIHTDLGHNDVLAKRQQFEQFLKTSCLRDLKK